MMRRASILFALLLPALAACDKQGAWGEVNSIIIATSPELWDAVGDTVKRALEPRTQTVRDELMFQVTHQDPAGEHWGDLRRFKQLLLVGTAEAPWMQAAIDLIETPPAPPAIVQVHDVWARDQLATIVLLPSEGDAQALVSQLPELSVLFERQYRDWARSRMYLSGTDTARQSRLRSEHGFSLLLPTVYQSRSVENVHFFRNDNPDPSELIREVVVTWRPISDATMDPEALLAWRSELSTAHYSYPQIVDLTNAMQGPIDVQGRQGYQLQAVWRNPPESSWPAGGPFILRAIPCPGQDRFYLIDAWLYAPAKQKYEYMIQLETLLDSFRCGG